MSARDELEAVIWRNFNKRGTQAAQAVDAILDAADAYAVAVRHEAEDTPRATARRRAVLAEAVRDLYGPEDQHPATRIRWRAS